MRARVRACMCVCLCGCLCVCKYTHAHMDVPDKELPLHAKYEKMLKSMADCNTLLECTELNLNKNGNYKIQTLLNELERNTIVQRMVVV